MNLLCRCIVLVLLLLVFSCKKENDEVLPEIAIISVDSVSYHSAVIGIKLFSEGSSPVVKKGICWAETPPSIDNYNEELNDTGKVSVIRVDSLLPGTLYYIKAFAQNQFGIVYSQSDSILTRALSAPVVNTSVVSQITPNSALCSGSISDIGGEPVVSCGFLWDTNETFSAGNQLISDTDSTLSFSSLLSGLKPKSVYFVRAFATNKAGTGFGSIVTFETLPPLLPKVDTDSLFNISFTSAVGVGHFSNEGGSTIIECGFCWSESPNPTINDYKKPSPYANGKFWSALTDLNNGTSYYARAYVIIEPDVIYGKTLTFKTLDTKVTYTLHKSASPTSTEQEMYRLIETAMNEACSYYSKYIDVSKHLNVYYNSGVPTADANFNGTIRFGQKAYMQKITAMHEIAHTFGVGTSPNWPKLLVNGVYTGAKANKVYQSITGNTNDKLKGDGTHFWPYGLNYTSEVKSENDLINHCKIVNAMVKDGL